jgi:hypothetical protein
MNKFITTLGICLILSACVAQNSSQTGQVVQPKVENCPADTVVALPKIQDSETFADKFNYHIYNILADADTIKFQTLKQDFVFCRGNNTWTVQPGTLAPDSQPPINYAELAQELVNPQFKNIDFQGKTYQYRVVREPGFSLDENNLITRDKEPAPAEDKVVFELVNPENQTTQRQTLYTLQDLQAAAVKQNHPGMGNQLGFPRITQAVTYGNSIWWSVAFEQGEGNSGIPTIVNYDPQMNNFTLIQPEALGFTQINDLVITGEAKNLTLWMGTQISGEGNPYIPDQGLVAYRFDLQNPSSGDLTAYTVHNSPLVGAIPNKLRLENDQLWVSTANGVCQLQWQSPDNPNSWNCWRFAVMANLPSEKIPLYPTSRSEVAQDALVSQNGGETVEVLWWSPVDFQSGKGRYEVRYTPGFTSILNDGADLYEFPVPPGKPPVSWPGFYWHWNGQRFVRGFDQVSWNLVGGGPQGIGGGQFSGNVPVDWNTIRGDLELLEVSGQSTRLKYYSGWVDEAKLQPYLTVVPQKLPANPQPNPLTAIAKQLPSQR